MIAEQWLAGACVALLALFVGLVTLLGMAFAEENREEAE